MTVAAAVEDTVDVITIADMVDAETSVSEAMVETVTIMPLAESIATLVRTDTAVEERTDVEVVEDTADETMTEATVALLVKLLHQPPPMVIQHLVERHGNHTEVEATMMRDSPVVNIDC